MVELAEGYVASNGYTDAPLSPRALAQLADDEHRREIIAAVRRGTLKPRAYGLARKEGGRRWFVIFEFTGRGLTRQVSRTEAGQAIAVDLDQHDVHLVDKMFLLAAVQKRLRPL